MASVYLCAISAVTVPPCDARVTLENIVLWPPLPPIARIVNKIPPTTQL